MNKNSTWCECNVLLQKKKEKKREGSTAHGSSHFENRRWDLRPFRPRNTVSVARRLEVEEVATRSSCPSRARFRFELDRVYGGCERSSSGSGSSKLSRNAG